MLGVRMLRWLVLIAVVAAGTMVATPSTAHACSCILRNLAEYADRASVAFTGRQLERVVQDYVGDNGAALVFRVGRVYRGEVGSLIEVRTHAQGPACGIDVGGQDEVGIVAETWRGQLSVNRCGSVVTPDELEEVFGAGYPPDESIRLTVASDSEESPLDDARQDDERLVAASQSDGSARDRQLLTVLLVAGAAVLVLAGAITWRRRRWLRRRGSGGEPAPRAS